MADGLPSGSDAHAGRAGPALDQFAGLSYLFVFVSVIDAEFSRRAGELFAAAGVGVDDVRLGVLLVGAVLVLGLYFRTRWALVGCLGFFGGYSALTFFAGELTISGVAILCAVYLLSRAGVVLDAAR